MPNGQGVAPGGALASPCGGSACFGLSVHPAVRGDDIKLVAILGRVPKE